MADKQNYLNSDCQDEVKLTELTTIKASYEYLNKTYRGNQKSLEKDYQSMIKSIEDYRKANDHDNAKSCIGLFLDNVSNLKRKAVSIIGEELNYTKTCKIRLDHLLNLSTATNNNNTISGSSSTTCTNKANDASGGLQQYDIKCDNMQLKRMENIDCTVRFQRHLADHLFARGYCQTAVQLAKSISSDTAGSGYDPVEGDDGHSMGMVEIYQETLDIVEALKKGEFQPVEQWLQSIQFKYKKGDVKNSFESDLQIFKLYLLVKEGSWERAIKFAHSFCDPKLIKKEAMDKLSKVMTLVVFRSYEELVAAARKWDVDEVWIVQRFHSFILQFYSFYHEPTVLSLMVKTGIAVRKTENCYKPEMRRKECVVCTDRVNKISIDIPAARHDHSILICWKTSLEMNEDNPPIAFPNGYVYSTKAIPELLDPTDNKVVCPRSGCRCKESELQKVFIV